MDRYLLTQLPSASGDVIFTPKSFNPKADELKTIDEFKLNLRLIYWPCLLLAKNATDSLAAARSFLATGVLDYK